MELVLAFRIVHILTAIFWAGSVAFLTLVLGPHLRRRGPQEEMRVMGPLSALVGKVLGAVSLTVLASGVGLVLAMHGGNTGAVLFGTGWGYAILTGFLATTGAILIAFGGIKPTGDRLRLLGPRLATANPHPPAEAVAEVQRLVKRLHRLENLEFGLVALAGVMMALARYL